MSTDTAAMKADPAIRPFHAEIAEEAITDLRRRIAAWRPPEREPVDDQSQGVQLATVQDLANYWAMVGEQPSGDVPDGQAVEDLATEVAVRVTVHGALRSLTTRQTTTRAARPPSCSKETYPQPGHN